jgi:hypothetical protein
MKELLNSPPVNAVCKVTTALVIIWMLFKAALYAISIYWPLYEYALELQSPDARYDLVVLRGDAAAFDDFSYKIYVFPHTLTPKEKPSGKQILMTGIWRDRQYLIYSGYSLPMFRWTATNAIEIDINSAYNEVSEFYPVKWPYSDTTIQTSLVIGKEDARNVMP